MIRFDYAGLMEEFVGEKGFSTSELQAILDRGTAEIAAVEQERSEGQHAFRELPYRETVSFAKRPRLYDALRERDVLLHVGIGGSSLGPRALVEGLQGEVADAVDLPSLCLFLENPDPEALEFPLDTFDPEDCVVHIVSKSGQTAETLSIFLVLRAWLQAGIGENWWRHLIITTNPENGYLRGVVNETGCVAFDVPEGVGGRFSVLTPVGLIPALAAGIPVERVLAGAAAMDVRCKRTDAKENPGYLLGTLLAEMAIQKGCDTQVLMAYSNAMNFAVDWYCQLWAESLGKPGPDGHGVGPTPVSAVGAVDQHSQLQLFMEGPNNKVVGIGGVDRFREECLIPTGPEEHEAVDYLKGKPMASLLNAERDATHDALIAAGRPSYQLLLKELTPESMGGFFYLWEVATIYAARVFGVNPYDQPGVEASKRGTYSRMGRPGYDAGTVGTGENPYVVG